MESHFPNTASAIEKDVSDYAEALPTIASWNGTSLRHKEASSSTRNNLGSFKKSDRKIRKGDELKLVDRLLGRLIQYDLHTEAPTPSPL